MAAGSDAVDGAGFGGGAADDGTRGSCTMTMTIATTRTVAIAAASTRTVRMRCSALQLGEDLGQLVEKLAGKIAEPPDSC